MAESKQARLDTNEPNSWSAETLPINSEYESRLQYLANEGRSLPQVDIDRYENASEDIKDQYKNSKPTFYGLDKNGEPRTKSRHDEKK